MTKDVAVWDPRGGELVGLSYLVEIDELDGDGGSSISKSAEDSTDGRGETDAGRERRCAYAMLASKLATAVSAQSQEEVDLELIKQYVDPMLELLREEDRASTTETTTEKE